MARLSQEVQRFIVEQLACFSTPSEVAAAVKERFGLEVKRQQVEAYEPGKVAAKHLSERWTALFTELRKQFVEDVTAIAISQRAFRLSRLDRMARAAEAVKNYRLAADLHKQAAEEVGNVYTNHRSMKLDGQVQGGVLMIPTPVSAEEWTKAAAAQQASLPGANATVAGAA